MLNCFSSAALFILFAASARTGIIGINLLRRSLFRFLRTAVILIGTCYLSYLLSFHLLLDSHMIQKAQGILLDGTDHLIEHVIGGHLILHLRIFLTIGLQSDTLAKLIHIVDMIHPFTVDDFQEDDTLQLAQLLRLGELCLFHLVASQLLL